MFSSSQILVVPVLLFLTLLAAGCVSQEVAQEPVGIPLSPEEVAFLEKLNDPNAGSVVMGTPELFFHLRQLNESWYESSLFKNSHKHLRIYTNLGAILTRHVYLNFDKVIDQLENGPQPDQVVAAFSLGFSRIPDNDRFPQVYPRALTALLRALESGDDDLTKNALLGIHILNDPSTPIEAILPLMAKHHDQEVRANAALCISGLVEPGHSDRVTPYLMQALKDEDPKVRLHAVSIALKIKEPSALSALVQLMNDRYELIRANAARALGELGNLSACEALIRSVDHPKEIVRTNCQAALKKLTGKDYGNDRESWQEWWLDYLEDQGLRTL